MNMKIISNIDYCHKNIPCNTSTDCGNLHLGHIRYWPPFVVISLAQGIDVIARQMFCVTAELSLQSSEYRNAGDIAVASQTRGIPTSKELSTQKYLKDVT